MPEDNRNNRDHDRTPAYPIRDKSPKLAFLYNGRVRYGNIIIECVHYRKFKFSNLNQMAKKIDISTDALRLGDANFDDKGPRLTKNTLDILSNFFSFDFKSNIFTRGSVEEFANDFNKNCRYRSDEDIVMDFCDRLVGLELMIGDIDAGQFDLHISVLFGSELQFRNYILSIKKFAVILYFKNNCYIINATRSTATERRGYTIGDEDEVTYFARGSHEKPTWIFKPSQENDFLDGGYKIHTPPACRIQTTNANWRIQAEGELFPKDFIVEFSDDEADINKKKIIARLAKLPLFDKESKLKTRMVTLQA
jgi:hypothetical protein